jgi:hypothetical protein
MLTGGFLAGQDAGTQVEHVDISEATGSITSPVHPGPASGRWSEPVPW